MAATRWGDRAGRRRDILDAARGLLEDAGYAGLNVRDVAKGAGVAPGTVYTYFGSKEEMFAVLYAERLAEFHTAIAAVGTATAEEMFAEVAMHYFAMYSVYGRELNVWSVLFDEGGFPEEVATPLIEAAARVVVTLSAGLEKTVAGEGKRFAEGELDLAMPFLWATLHGLADHFCSARQRIHTATQEQLVAFAAQTLVAGLRARLVERE